MKYQQRAWSLFKKHPIKGTEIAVSAYIKINESVFSAWKRDMDGKNFFEYVEQNAEMYRNEERSSLLAFAETRYQ